MSDALISCCFFKWSRRDSYIGTLFECMGICVLSPAHESEMRGYFVYLLIVKYLLILFKFRQYIRLDGLIMEFWGDFLKHF